MRSLTFYRWAVPMALRNAWLRVQCWAIWYGGGILRGRWPWETRRELQAARKRHRETSERIFAPVRAAILGRAPGDTGKGGEG